MKCEGQLKNGMQRKMKKCNAKEMLDIWFKEQLKVEM